MSRMGPGPVIIRPRPNRPGDPIPTGVPVQLGLGQVEFFHPEKDARNLRQLRRDIRTELDAIWAALDYIAKAIGIAPAPHITKV